MKEIKCALGIWVDSRLKEGIYLLVITDDHKPSMIKLSTEIG